MKKQISPILLIFMIMAITLACRLPGFGTPTATDVPQTTQVIIEAEATATEDGIQMPEPTETENVPPTLEPTPTDPAPTAGQIAYTYNGNVWRYLVDSGEIVQVTTDGVMGDQQNTYGRPGISPDGHYLAFNKGSESTILDLTNNAQLDISSYGQFFVWTDEANQFFGVQGDFACPDIENLEDQDQINFEILRFDIDNLANPTLLSNIGGGLKFLSAISSDGQWASIVFCGCYSECGHENLWFLPTATGMTPPISLYPGNFAFSPDNLQLTVSQHQMYGYIQSPLYVANINFTNMVEIFSIPNVAPINAQWSPDGQWIAFTGVVFSDDEFTDTDRCVRLIKPDGSQEYVVQCAFSDFVTWSPDGDQLLYSQRQGTQEYLYIYDLAASSRTQLPIQADPYTRIDWGRLP